MVPAIVPGLGMGVLVGSQCQRLRWRGAKCRRQGRRHCYTRVLVGCARVGEESGSKVEEDNGSGCADWVKPANVKHYRRCNLTRILPRRGKRPRQIAGTQAGNQESGNNQIKWSLHR